MTAEDLDTAPCGFVIFRDDGKVTDVNTTLLSLSGYTAEELLGYDVGNIFNLAGRIFYQTYFFPLIRMYGIAEEIFIKLRSKAGTEIPVICNAVRKHIEGEAFIHCVIFKVPERGKYEEQLLLAKKNAEAALYENTELLKAKGDLQKHVIELDRRLSQLLHMNRDLGQFGKIISHDFQENIRKIAIFTSSLSNDHPQALDDSLKTHLHEIELACGRMRDLTTQLERFINLNVDPATFTSVDLNSFFNNQAGFEIKKAELPVIMGDHFQLSLLFEQLLLNSAQFQAEHRPLSVRVDASIVQQNGFKQIKDEYRYIDFVQLTITDNGTGFHIDPGQDIFAIRRKTKSGPINLSFGLAIAKKIVDNHFGFIQLSSVPGEGTSVIIHLPV